jgi:amino acid transporter
MEEKKYDADVIGAPIASIETHDDQFGHGTVNDNADDLQRHLGNRQIQLIAIGGSIGTALFISIGGGLNSGGPLGILLAYTGYSCIIALVSNAMAEMAVFMPVSGGFIRLAGHWVDDALG